MYYWKCGFWITTLHVDDEFEPLQELIHKIPGGPRVNLSSSSEHVSYIERLIRVAKERILSIRHSLTFNKVLKQFFIHLMFQAIKMLNKVPVEGSISDIIIPTTFNTGKSLHYKNISFYRVNVNIKYTS